MKTKVLTIEEKMINAGNKGIDAYYDELKYVRGTFFDSVKCLESAKERAFLSYKIIVRKQSKEISKEELKKGFEELFQKVIPVIKARISSIRDRFQKRLIIKEINTTSANAIVQTSLEENGFHADVSTQTLRAKVSIQLTENYSITFFIRYKDLYEDGEMDRIVRGLKEIRSELETLNFSVSIRRLKD